MAGIRGVRSGIVCSSVVALAVAAVLAAPHQASAALGDCSQPISGGDNPTPTDCLTILRKAVNLPAPACNPECICAPGGALPVSPTDALVCLRRATNLPQELACPCGVTTSSSTTSTSTSTSSTSMQIVDTTTTTLGGVEEFEFDTACLFVELESNQFGVTEVFSTGTLTLAVDNGSLSDALHSRTPNGLEEVQVEITDLSFMASDGGFNVTVSLNDNVHPAIDQRTVGVIEEQVNNMPGVLEFPATCRIDTFIQALIVGPFINETVHNDIAISFEGTVGGIPVGTDETHTMTNTEDIPVLDPSDNPFQDFVIDTDDVATLTFDATSCE